MAPHQATLDGVQAPEPPPDALPKVAALGRLVQAARLYTATDGMPHISALIQQQRHGHPQALPLLAEYAYPDLGCPSATAMAAADKARQMRAGAHVAVLGYGIEPARQQGLDVFRITRVLDIWLTDELGHPLGTTAPQPAAQEA